MQLQGAGMKGSIVVVLCGPFTSTQKAKTYEKTRVNPHKVRDAYQWLVNNNKKYEGMAVPDLKDIPQPTYFYKKL